jgi:protocatechuate 3,4-dioxygenase, beta subunit
MRRWTLARVILPALMFTVPALGQQGPPPTPEPLGHIGSKSAIAASGEAGEPLLLSGQLFAPDGKTPAPNVTIYAYQTDATGEYHNGPDRVARLHGWARTDRQGRFEFTTIRPAPYPGRSIAAHIHMHAWGGGYPLQWTADAKFADDPLISTRDRADSEALGPGFDNICAITRSIDGVWHCSIRLRLQRETNYAAQYRDDPRTRP